MAGIRGAQVEYTALLCTMVQEQWQGVPAPMGVDTLLPFQLLEFPRQAAGFKLFVALNPSSEASLQRQGVDYSVNISTRRVTWLATARMALPSTCVILATYYRVGPKTGDSV